MRGNHTYEFFRQKCEDKNQNIFQLILVKKLIELHTRIRYMYCTCTVLYSRDKVLWHTVHVNLVLVLCIAFAQFIIVWGVVCAPPLEYRSESTSYTYPEWATAVGWLISVASIFFVPTVAIYKLFSFRAASFKQVRAPPLASRSPCTLGSSHANSLDSSNKIYSLCWNVLVVCQY